MSTAPISHDPPLEIQEGSKIYCKRCGQPIPKGKLGCEPCFWLVNNEHFLQHQKRYAELIAKNKIELHLVYIAGGGERSPLWHLQRFGDTRRGYCGAELPAGNRQDHLKFHELYQRDKFCTLCAKTLAEVIDAVPVDRSDNPPL